VAQQVVLPEVAQQICMEQVALGVAPEIVLIRLEAQARTDIAL
jgi:hypothetical protein